MSDQRTAKQEVAEALEALLGVIEAGDSQCWSLQAKATDRVRAVIKRLRTVDETAVLCPACQELRTLRKIVKAWEALPGGRNYSYHEIQDWLIEDMKPAIDAARKVIKEQSK